MIPTLDAVMAAHRFIARRFGVATGPNADLVSAALDEAAALARTEFDEPAALFFALARRQRAFPGLWTAVTSPLVLNHARRLGLRVDVDLEQLLAMYVPIQQGRLSFEGTRERFHARRE